MPRASRWFIRASLLHLMAGFTLGALLLAVKGAGVALSLWRALPLHQELLLVGWMVQLTMGVAFWILPRLRPGPHRGRVEAVWAAFFLLNAGTLASGLGPTLGLPAYVRLAGRGAEVAAALAFGLNAWPRVVGSR